MRGESNSELRLLCYKRQESRTALGFPSELQGRETVRALMDKASKDERLHFGDAWNYVFMDDFEYEELVNETAAVETAQYFSGSAWLWLPSTLL